MTSTDANHYWQFALNSFKRGKYLHEPKEIPPPPPPPDPLDELERLLNNAQTILRNYYAKLNQS